MTLVVEFTSFDEVYQGDLIDAFSTQEKVPSWTLWNLRVGATFAKDFQVSLAFNNLGDGKFEPADHVFSGSYPAGDAWLRAEDMARFLDRLHSDGGARAMIWNGAPTPSISS